MDNMQVQRELTTLLRQAAGGISPKTSGWTGAIDEMFDRGVTPSEILARAKTGLADDWHRPRLIDNGAKYINWNFAKLSNGFDSKPKVGRTVESMKYEGWRHQRWEVALHTERVPLEERRRWLEQYMSAHGAEAYDMVECLVCSTEK